MQYNIETKKVETKESKDQTENSKLTEMSRYNKETTQTTPNLTANADTKTNNID